MARDTAASDIEVTSIDGLSVMRLERAAKKNALDRAMYTALADALEAGEANAAIAGHVILGSGGVFCAGNDITDFLGIAKGGGLGDEIVRFVRLLAHLDKPFVAAVDGPAIGIGTTLLLHCDLVYASERAVFATPFVDLGLVPEAGSSLLMPARIGHARAFAMFVLGEALNARQALDCGLINGLVAADTLEAHALGAARRIAAKPPTAVRATKALMRGPPAALSARIEEEIAAFESRLRSGEAREAFAAFLEKRRPDFRTC